MFAREVYPRLKEAFPDTTISGTFGDVPPRPPEEGLLLASAAGAGKAFQGEMSTPLGVPR